ncbi:WXG100-like domain-containing protein [Mycolicibacterium thermoresistibile]
MAVAVGAAGGRIEVDPEAVIGAGRNLGSLGSQLGMLSDALGSALSSGIASGLDPAGVKVGLTYGRQAQDFATQLANAANAFKGAGHLLEATGVNYRNADAASTIGGSGAVVDLSGEPGWTTAGDISAGPNSAVVPAPPQFALLQPFFSMAWPSGNPAMLRLTAAQWRNFAHGFAVFEPQLVLVKAVVSAQNTPETPAIVSDLDELARGISALADASVQVAHDVEDFASTVHETQDAIRRLLDRVSIGGLFDTLKGVLTGDGENILREVARDVRTVLDNFQRQVKGVIGLLEELTTLIGDAATAFQKWVRPKLVAVFGEQHGGAMADRLKIHSDLGVGAVTGLIGTVSSLVALADSDTWKGLADLAVTAVQDPSTVPGVLQTVGKNLTAWDKWTGENPGRAAGEAFFNIGSLILPSGVIGGTSRAASALGRASNALDSTRAAVRPAGVPSPGGNPLSQGAVAGRGGERAPVSQQPSSGQHYTSSNKPPSTSALENTAAIIQSTEARKREEAEGQS